MEEFNFISPMKAQTSDVSFLERVSDDVAWAAGEKFDGYREQLHLGETRNELFSSAGNSHIAKVPQFGEVVPELAGTVLDCEGLSSTRLLEDNAACFKADPLNAIAWQQERGWARLVAFDVLRFCGEDVRNLSFASRRVILLDVADRLCWVMPLTSEVLVFEAKLDYYNKIVARSVAEGHEGVILKDMSAPYCPGKRGSAWLKVKRFERLEYEIVWFEPGTGKYTDMVGAIAYGLNGRVLGTASGMSDDERIDMTVRPEAYLGRVAVFECQEITSYGVMRHPRYLHMKEVSYGEH